MSPKFQNSVNVNIFYMMGTWYKNRSALPLFIGKWVEFTRSSRGTFSFNEEIEISGIALYPEWRRSIFENRASNIKKALKQPRSSIRVRSSGKDCPSDFRPDRSSGNRFVHRQRQYHDKFPQNEKSPVSVAIASYVLRSWRKNH